MQTTHSNNWRNGQILAYLYANICDKIASGKNKYEKSKNNVQIQ